jgi:hypothetical protein
MKIIIVIIVTISYIAAMIGINMMNLPVPATILLVLATIACGGFAIISLCSQRRTAEEKNIGEKEQVESNRAIIS